ncbi:50S ribosomal protein L22 [Candidatus Peregrinibacteria bacterium]|nr:50S ribosomal protein L22 [Candidatus Peregrinibacteria bacterium]
MKAILRQVRISSKKANLIATLVRRKNVQEALDILTYTTKKGAKILRKVIYSAAKNAENNNKQDFETLKIKEIIVTEGATYKRSVPVSRGRSNPILKRTAHITVKVEAGEAKKKAKTKKEPAIKNNI